jgi:hypothetical protein
VRCPRSMPKSLMAAPTASPICNPFIARTLINRRDAGRRRVAAGVAAGRVPGHDRGRPGGRRLTTLRWRSGGTATRSHPVSVVSTHAAPPPRLGHRGVSRNGRGAGRASPRARWSGHHRAHCRPSPRTGTRSAVVVHDRHDRVTARPTAARSRSAVRGGQAPRSRRPGRHRRSDPLRQFVEGSASLVRTPPTRSCVAISSICASPPRPKRSPPSSTTRQGEARSDRVLGAAPQCRSRRHRSRPSRRPRTLRFTTRPMAPR